MVELGSHAATERVALVTLYLTVSCARILSRHPHAPFRGSRRRVTASGDPVAASNGRSYRDRIIRQFKNGCAAMRRSILGG